MFSGNLKPCGASTVDTVSTDYLSRGRAAARSMARFSLASTIVKLAEHLVVGKHLSRVAAAQLEEAPQQSGFVHPSQQQDVSRDGGLDQRVEDVAPPALRFAYQRAAPGKPPK
jgi:hypothetical protein